MYHTSCETGENYHQNLLLVTSGVWRRQQRYLQHSHKISSRECL